MLGEGPGLRVSVVTEPQVNALTYEDFLAQKQRVVERVGFEVDAAALHSSLFPFQRDIVQWSLKLGRAAIFAGTGTGKTRMQTSFADAVEKHTQRPVFIVAPLAVAQQTVNEATVIGIDVRHVREANEIGERGIYITNYDRADRFDPAMFAGVVLDESSRLKAYSSKTCTQMIESWQGTRFRLACTATPAPNDYMELANHSEFLGVLTRVEMLATFFTHDSGETQSWRIKGHAQDAFWKWMSSWSVMLTSPSDLGYDGSQFVLPPLTIKEQIVESKPTDAGMLFAVEAQTLNERRSARRSSIGERVRIVEDLVASEPDESWLIWCDLNDESGALANSIDGAVEVRGSDESDIKESRLLGFATGEHRVLVTKPKIAGYGMNWQNCARVVFCGVSDSFEQFFQAIRRCYRFGQTREVIVYVITSSAENAVLQNLKKKERNAQAMVAAMVGQIQMYSELSKSARNVTLYGDRNITLPAWLETSA
jgi:superfamily II DNA or RNA helicase